MALDHALIRLHRGLDPDYLTVRFWRNPSCVVLGRGQSIEHEVDLHFCEENGVAVCRRLSGGGTVYHDLGNINISLFLPRVVTTDLLGLLGASEELTQILALSLRECGAPYVESKGPYDIFSEGRKVSGAASYLTRTSFLHHSTLLVSTDLSKLENCLVHHHPPYKRGESRYTPTGNLSDLPVDHWKATLTDMVSERFRTELNVSGITIEEESLARSLLSSTYSTGQWLNQQP